ncbi:MAG: tyrosine-type recombinase/integrase [Bryobacterales bacterium]|nr:tyrosine-type recombinase/integrase [Bryobacterales bacterium]
MLATDIHDVLGLRDRAILETFYSTGIRRLELVSLKLWDLDLERATVTIRLGKGKKDRFIPLGDRCAAWIARYLVESRPRLVSEPDDRTVFLSNAGEPFSVDGFWGECAGRREPRGEPVGEPVGGIECVAELFDAGAAELDRCGEDSGEYGDGRGVGESSAHWEG